MTLNITTIDDGGVRIGNERGGILFLNKSADGGWSFGVHPDNGVGALVTFTDDELTEVIAALSQRSEVPA